MSRLRWSVPLAPWNGLVSGYRGYGNRYRGLENQKVTSKPSVLLKTKTRDLGTQHLVEGNELAQTTPASH
jgi:hypothetical protein